MAHALVSTVLQQLGSVISEEAGSVIFKEVTLVLGTPQEVENLTFTLESIQAVLIDAEEKQVKEKTVKLWLERLKDVLYDMEDVLDEWSTEILRSEIEGVGVLKKVCSYLLSLCNCNSNCFSQVSLRHKIGHKIKEIKGRLDVIAKDKDQFQFIDSGMTAITTIAEPPIFRMTSSLIDVLEVCGRDDDKDKILSRLLSESSRQETPNVLPIVISICGPGGYGKTTLAQMVFNDHEVKKHFEKRMWVCVSDPFDLTRLAKAIIKGAGGQNVSNNIEWQDLHQELCTSVMGKRFLLVLDDMWTEKHTDWSPLKLALNGGAPGSRIVVTTRIKKVALMMDSAYTHDLGKLSEEKCLVLFKRIAFHGWSKDEREKVEDIGVDIVKKCKGVPLFVKALGGHMFFKKTRLKWEQVLKSDAWELEEVEKGVLPVLLLSYYDLPSNVKRCLTYCSIFPKDHEIRKDELIKLWMAHGLLNSTRSTELEVVGDEYFDELLMRSFFQRDRNTFYYKMHDLIHDFAQFLTKTECFIMEGNNIEFNNNSKKVRHLNVAWFADLSSILPSICEAKNLRTLMIDGDQCASLSVPALSDLFCQLTYLRELSLCIPNLEELPNEVEKLIHLRYFDLSGTSLRELPETMCRLYNLQTLKLNYCERLCKLPQGMRKMLNLRYLEIGLIDELSYLPHGIGRLSSLRELALQNLPKLQVLPTLGNLPVLESLKIMIMNSVKRVGVEFLGINVDVDDDGTKRGGGESRVVVAFPRLKVLSFDDMYELEEWDLRVEDGVIMPCLRKLTLRYLPKLQLLPTLGNLPVLESLEIRYMKSVKRVGVEFLGINVDVDDDGTKRGGGESRVVVAFPQLKELVLYGMDELEEWEMLTREEEEEEEHAAGSGGGRDIIIIIMPLLHTLFLYDCPELKELPHYIFPASLRELVINDCPKLSWTPCLPPLLEELSLFRDVGVLSRSLPTNQVNNSNNNLKSLDLLMSPHSSLPEGLAHLTSLQNLSIRHSDSLMCMSEELKQLTSLQSLDIIECSVLGARCQKEVGEDWSIISHIPNIKINDRDVRGE